MRRFSWLGFVPGILTRIRPSQRPFLSSIILESSTSRGNLDSAVFASYWKLVCSRGLHACCFDRKPAILNTVGKPLSKHYIHARGYCFSTGKDYYKILGVPETATWDEIKQAFHRLAKKYHPDANRNNPSAKRKFQEIRDAYETLRDPERKAQYDREHIGGKENVKYASGNADGSEHAGDAEGFQHAYGNYFTDSFRKIFSEIFEREVENLAKDIEVELSLSFSEATKGCTKHMSFDSYVPCDICNGRGYPLNAKKRVCPTCEGIGKVTIPPFTSTCSTCRGMGKIIKECCVQCQGSGIIEGVKEVKVIVPAGVDSGDTIRVAEAGNFGGRGSKPGSLLIKLKVSDDPIFSRDGADVYVDVNISFTQAILGGKVEVPTLYGKVQVNIPKGVQPGQLLMLRGKGLPMHGFFGDHGDQYVCFRIKLPTDDVHWLVWSKVESTHQTELI